MNKYIGLLLSAATGVLLALSGFQNGIFAWIALVPVGIALQHASVRRGAIYGFIGGVCAGILLFYGVLRYGVLYYLVLIIQNALQGALSAVAYVILLKKVRNPLLNIFVPPLAWIFFEYLRTIGAFSFPIPLGASQHSFLALLQFASIAGVYGLTLIILLVNRIIVAWIVELPIIFRAGFKDMKKIGHITTATLLVFSFLIILLSWGNYLLNKNPVEEAKIKISALHGGIPIEFYWKQLNNESMKASISDIFFEMTEAAFKYEKPDVLVWPEGAIYDKVMELDEYKNRIIDYAKKYNSIIVMGAPGTNDEGYITNSAYVISGEGNVAGRYDKVKIIPFLEGYRRGAGYYPISTKLGKFGIVICFESIYPQVLRDLTLRGAEVLFFLTNDCGLAYSPLPAMHGNDAVLRAVENRRYVVMANQYGLSLIADPFGRVLKKYDGTGQEIITGYVNTKTSVTFYNLFGDYVPLLSLLICLIPFVKKI